MLCAQMLEDSVGRSSTSTSEGFRLRDLARCGLQLRQRPGNESGQQHRNEHRGNSVRDQRLNDLVSRGTELFECRPLVKAQIQRASRTDTTNRHGYGVGTIRRLRKFDIFAPTLNPRRYLASRGSICTRHWHSPGRIRIG